MEVAAYTFGPMPPEADPPTSPNAPPQVAPVPYRRWLHVLAMWLVVATFGLIVLGGAVTSHDAGMAVPRGWDTFGVWSLVAPLELWWDDPGTRLEHSHRLKGYVVGFSTAALLLAVLWTQRGRWGVKWLAVAVAVLVIAQAVLGILRVDENSAALAGIHGVTGQVFFAMTVWLAAVLGRAWMQREQPPGTSKASESFSPAQACNQVPKRAWVWLLLLLVQLCLGAAVRHGQASLAIPDWPLHYGQVMPPMNDEAITAAVAALPEATAKKMDHAMLGEPVTAWRVHLHFTHRVVAYAILVFGLMFLPWVARRWAEQPLVRRVAGRVAILLILQVLLGVSAVLTGIGATTATLHQTVGALLLGASVWLVVRMKRFPASGSHETNTTPDERIKSVPNHEEKLPGARAGVNA